MPKLNFAPDVHGFHFVNGFTNHVGPFTTNGLCGGMSLAAFNYYRSGTPVPTHRRGSFGTSDELPPENSRLRNYIFGQQLGSFASAAGFFFATWPWESDTDVLRNQYRASLNDFDRVRRAIDYGRFVLLGLRSSTRGDLIGHQVLAYGYEESPPCVWIYDSNHPDLEMMVEADPTTERVVHKHADGARSGSADRYASFFVQLELDPLNADVLTGASRPDYVDLGAQAGLTVSAPVGDGLRQVGERLRLDAMVRNFGDHQAHVRQFLLWARDPRGRNRDDEFGYRDVTISISPGQEIRLQREIEHFGDDAGVYSFGLSYLSEQDHWIEIPAIGTGARSAASVELVAGVDAGRDYGTGGYAGPGIYFICARHSGKVLDVNIDFFSGQNNGRPIAQVDNNNGDHQKFIIEPLPDGYVRIRAKHSGKCVDVENASTLPGAGLHQWECNGAENQQFLIEPVGDHYRIKTRHSGLYFDIAGVSLNNGARLTQWDWWAGNNQLFQFLPTA